MAAAANMVEVAALVGDTARATMLAALMGGQALTASELASLAHVTRPTASGHLGKLAAARLVAVTQSGATAITASPRRWSRACSESIKAVAALETPARYQPRSAQDDALRFARSCYDHSRVGWRCARRRAGGEEVRRAGRGGRCAHRARAQVSLRLRRRSRRDIRQPAIFCRACLDWSERRYHVAGLVGAAILAPSSRSTGWRANAAAARCFSRGLDSAVCARRSASPPQRQSVANDDVAYGAKRLLDHAAVLQRQVDNFLRQVRRHNFLRRAPLRRNFPFAQFA